MEPGTETATDVLIIGAGPSGLFLAAELTRHGVRPRIIDRNPAVHRQTRATCIQPASLELFHRAGVLDGFLAHAIHTRGIETVDYDDRVVFAATTENLDTPFPAAAFLAQSATEDLLNARLQALGLRVERGVEAEAVEALPGATRVHLRHPDGRKESLLARFVADAGGAHSLLRGVLHEHLDGQTYPDRFLVADISGDVARTADKTYMHYSPAGFVFMGPLPDERWLVVMNLPQGELPPARPTLAQVALALHSRLRHPPKIRELHWSSYYHTHCRVAPRLGDGCRFILGDAAHICSPFGAEGMNSGWQDAASLAWQLALVLRNLGRSLLLEAYAVERLAAAHQVLASTDAIYRGICHLSALAQTGLPLQRPEPDPAHPIIASHMLDVTWPASPIVGEFRGDGVAPLPAGSPGTRFRDRTLLTGESHHLLVFDGKDNSGPDLSEFSRRWNRQLTILDGSALGPAVSARAGLPHGGALLVRPDGYVGFRANPWNSAALAALDSHLEKQWLPA